MEGMWWLPLVTAGVGMLQSKMQNDAAEKARAQQNRINAYSPLLGTTPQALTPYSAESNVLGGAMGGALSGFNQLQAYNQQQAQNKMFETQTRQQELLNQLIGSKLTGVPDSTNFAPYLEGFRPGG